MTNHAVIYIRVSTTVQAIDGVSLNAQRAKLEAWCNVNDYALTAVHIDAGVSGCRADNRVELQTAINLACSQKAALVVYSLSRLARSTKDAIEIAEKLDRSGADLVSISERIDTSCAAGKMVFRMLAVLAEFERDQIAERTSLALQHKKARGELVGAVPYGYRLNTDGVKLAENDHEQRVIRLAQKLRERGLSYRKVSSKLSEQGHVNRRGKPFSVSSMQNMIAGN